MKFKPGNKLSPGRPKGTPNKDKALVREIVEESLKGKTIPQRLLELAEKTPREEIGILLDLMPYCYPKLQATELSGEVGVTGSGEAVTDLVEWLKSVREIK